METEVIIREPHDKRIRKIIKVDISREIQNECQKSMEFILFTQSQQITQLFSLLEVVNTNNIYYHSKINKAAEHHIKFIKPSEYFSKSLKSQKISFNLIVLLISFPIIV